MKDSIAARSIAGSTSTFQPASELGAASSDTTTNSAGSASAARADWCSVRARPSRARRAKLSPGARDASRTAPRAVCARACCQRSRARASWASRASWAVSTTCTGEPSSASPSRRSSSTAAKFSPAGIRTQRGARGGSGAALRAGAREAVTHRIDPARHELGTTAAHAPDGTRQLEAGERPAQSRTQPASQLQRALRAALRIALDQARNDVARPLREVVDARLRSLEEIGVGEARVELARPGATRCEEFVQQDAQSEQVAARIRRQAEEHLGSHA